MSIAIFSNGLDGISIWLDRRFMVFPLWLHNLALFTRLAQILHIFSDASHQLCMRRRDFVIFTHMCLQKATECPMLSQYIVWGGLPITLWPLGNNLYNTIFFKSKFHFAVHTLSTTYPSFDVLRMYCVLTLFLRMCLCYPQTPTESMKACMCSGSLSACRCIADCWVASFVGQSAHSFFIFLVVIYDLPPLGSFIITLADVIYVANNQICTGIG